MDKVISGVGTFQQVLMSDPATGNPLTPPPFDLNLLAQAAQTATAVTPDQINLGGRGVRVFVNITNIGTGSITVNIQGKDPASGTYQTLLASAALAANGFNVLDVYPGVVAVANVVANTALPRVWRVQVVSNNANPVAYTVGATVLQ